MDRVLTLTEVTDCIVAVRGSKHEHIRTSIAFQRIIATIARDSVCAAPANQLVRTPALDRIRSTAPKEAVSASVTNDDVCVAATFDEIAASAAFDQIDASAAKQPVNATIAEHPVIPCAVYRENFRQATLKEDLVDARLSTERALSREQAARTALEDETVLRERFLHAVAHDLRQPLNALNFHLRRLRKKPTPEVATAFVNTAESCLSSAEAIIESVDGAAWMRGDLPPAALSPVALGPLLSAIASEAQPLAEHHGVSLTYVSTGAAVQADGEYLERVIRNLVRNAIQHAKSRILIEVRRSGADISVIVMDDGSGVPTDAQDAIFEPFYQVPGGGRRSAGNVGLGLSIVAELVRAMGGQVALKSAEGRGAAFQVVLPCAEKAASNYVPASMVMVIDDDDDAAGAVIAALELAGCSAHRYGGPLVAEAIAEAVRTATCPVFLDYHLGATVTAADALALLSEDERTPVTIVTSDTSPEVWARAREFGVTRILKPLGAEKIADILGSA